MTIQSDAKQTFTVFLELTEDEARALEAIAGYGVDAFLETFYKNLGSHYLKPHEQGARQLLDTVRKTMPAQLSRIDDARKIFEKP